jgi:hypothetical protein
MNRRSLISAVVLCFAVVLGSAWWLHSRTRPVVVTSVVTAPPSQSIAAPDCPPSDEGPCELVAAAPNALAAVGAHFPHATDLDSYAYFLPAQDNPSVETIRVRAADGVLVSVVGRCVPGGAVVPDRVSSPAALGPVQVYVVAGRGPGCSVAAELSVPVGVAVPLSAAQALVHDRAISVVR